MGILSILEKDLKGKKGQVVNEVKTETIHKNHTVKNIKTYMGLTQKEAEDILLRDGYNTIAYKKKIKPYKIFVNQYKDIMTLILLVCTAISIIMGEYVEAISIAIIVLMNGILGFIQEYKAEKTLEALKNMASPKARVYRDGELRRVCASEIVVDDMIMIKEGDKIPADCVLISSTNLQTDEAMLTGESIEVKKSEHSEDNNLYMGCIITKGNAIAKVTNTGMKTKMGSIANMLDDIKEEETPLQKRLASLSKYIAAGCLIICAVVTITGIIRGENIFDMLITGVSLAVAAVPEGLPAIVTISLALSVSRMVKRKALVKKLHAVETLGCADVICSDKTGTLTQNKMTATNIYIYDEEIDKESLLNQKVLLNAIKACNNASISESGAIGDQTEICLLRLIDGYSFKHDRISEIPFDSTRKRMSVTVKQDDGVFTYTKGAMDVLLKRCTGILTGNGVIEMTNERKRIIEQKNNEMADKALRVIAVTYSNGENASEEGLVFLGLIGMIDPPRKEVKSAVSLCKKAGIKTVMITGDHKKTAMAIAKELLIYRAGDMALTGEELDLMADEELSSLIENVTVFARVTPAHKLRIVRALKKRNHIVAMTGDGVNDAPAIKEADIGVSMGINGTDVTREASDIVLLDDNFATLVNAVEEGRSIYQNIRKFIRYLLSCNIGEVITMFVGMLIGMPIILLPIQILLINLVTDGLPAIALGVEPLERDSMLKKPRKADEGVFSNGLAGKIIFRGIIIGFVTLLSFTSVYKHTNNLVMARSGALFALVFAQLIHVFECKSEEKGIFEINYFNNIKLIMATAFSMIVLLCVIYLPALQVIFKTMALSREILFIPIFYCMLPPVLIGIYDVVCKKIKKGKEKNRS